MRERSSPMPGICAGTSVPTFVAKYDSVFQGSRYPEKPNPRVRKSRRTPDIQVTSRGERYAFRKNTESRCRKTAPTKRFAPHAWIDRMSQPKGTSAMMYWMLSKASDELGR